MTALVYIELSVSVVLLLLGGLILYLAPHRKINQALFIAALISAVTVVLEYLTRVAGTEHAALILGRFYITAWYFELWAFLQFSLEYHWASKGELVEKHRRGVVRILTILPVVVWSFVVVATDFLVSKASYQSWGYSIDIGTGFPVYFHLLFELCFGAAILVVLWKEAHRNEDKGKAKTGKLLFWGMAIPSLLAAFVDNIVTSHLDMPEIGSLALLLIISLFAYVCARERFLAITPVSVADEILENLGDGILLISSEGRMTYCNDYFQEVLGYTEKELTGVPFMDIGAQPAAVTELLEYIKKEGKVSCYGEMFDLEISLLGKEKDEIPFGVSGNYLGKGRGWALALRDLREKQRKELALQEKNQQFEEKTRILRDALDIASHELKNPLAAILAGLDVMDKVTSGEQRSEMQSFIKVNVTILDQLIESLLNASIIEQGRFPIEKENTDLGEILNSAVSEMKTRYPQRVFFLHRKEQLSSIYADANKLKQLLSILLDNAASYSDREVGLATAQDGDVIQVSVLDRGPGIAEEEAELVFGQFYRSEETWKKASTNVGLGLGLFIARNIVEGHGGKIFYIDRDGGGAEFCFSIPIVARSGR